MVMRAVTACVALAALAAPAPDRGLRLDVETEVRLEVRGRAPERFPLWPSGTLRTRWSVTQDAFRSDLLDRAGPLPAGTFVLRSTGGLLARVVLPDHRFFRLNLQQLGAPTVEVVQVTRSRRSFEYLGLTCSSVRAMMVLAAPPGAHERGWFPPEVAVNAEIWTTDALEDHRGLLAAFVETLGMPGMDDPRLKAEVRMPLKVAFRLMGKLSGTLTMTVTSFAAEEIPAAEFDLPDDATEIPSPLSPAAIIGQAVPER